MLEYVKEWMNNAQLNEQGLAMLARSETGTPLY